jgi:hypothetical protein
MARTDDRPNPRPLQVLDPRSYGLPARPTANVDQVEDALHHAATRCNLLAPMTKLDMIPPDHVISLRVVSFPPDWDQLNSAAKGDGNWYKLKGGNKIALSGRALDQLAAAAGISWVSAECGRQDDGSEVYVWHWRMTAELRDFDGRKRRITRERVVDLRKGAPEAEAMSAAQLKGARIHGPAMAESKAANRAVRHLLGISGGYHPAEAERPFVFPALVWVPDTTDPVIKRMVAAERLGIVGDVFGPGTLGHEEIAEGPAMRPVGETIDVQPDQRQAAGDYQRQAQPPAELEPPRSERWLPTEEERREIAEREAREARQPAPARRRSNPGQEPRRQAALPLEGGDQCDQCGRGVSASVADYSRRKFNRVLCMDDQQQAR